MKKIGIIGAMPIEIELLKERMQVEKITEKANRTFFEGKLGGVEIVLTTCGIGKVNSASCAQVLCSCFGVDALLNTGIAGALGGGVDVLDIVVASELVYHDFNADFVRIGISNFSAFVADPSMIELAVSVCEEIADGKKHFVGRIATGDEFVASRDRKKAIKDQFGGLCCEMEGAAIAHVATVNKVPFVVIRCISDNADDTAEMAYEEFEPIAAKKCANLVISIMDKISKQ